MVVQQCVQLGDQSLFKPCRLHKLRRKPARYTTFVSCLMFLPEVDETYGSLVICALLSIRSKITKSIRANIMNGSHRVLPKKLSFRGKPPWRDLPPVCDDLPKAICDGLSM